MTEYFASHPQIGIIFTVCATVIFLVILFIIAAKFKWLSNLHITKQGIVLTGSHDYEKAQDTQGRELREIKKALDDDRVDWNKRMEGFDRQFNEIKTETAAIKTDVQNVYRILADHEEFQEKLSQGTLENMLFSDSPLVSDFNKLKSFVRLIAMGKNGKIKSRGIHIILEKKELWEAVVETINDLKLNIVNQKYFDSVMEEINNRIFRY
jgi:hypothetical protein